MKRWICAAAAVVLAGCGNKAGTGGGTATASNGAGGAAKVFGVIPKQLNNPVFNLARDGAEQAAKEIGNASIKYTAPQQQDAAQQASIVENMVNAKVSGIAISCSDAAVLKPAIDKAVAAGVPVITWDSDSPNSKRATFYGVDDFKAGQKQAELLKKAIPGGGDVAILTGAPGAENLNRRIAGFKDGIKGGNLNVVATLPCNDDLQKSVSIVHEYTASHPNLKGWCMVGGWPLFAAVPGPFAGMKPGAVKVVSFDTLKPERDYVRQGYVDGLVGQKYFEWGHTSVKILNDLIGGKKFPPFVDSGMDVVTKANLEDFAKSHPA